MDDIKDKFIQNNDDYGYRVRFYESYLSGRLQAVAPATLEGLKPRIPSLRKLVGQHFPANRAADILELGCGYGPLIYVARRMGYLNTHGVDRSPEQVSLAQRMGIEGVRLCDAMEALTTQRDRSLDCVVAFDLIEHFHKNELLALADDVYRVLKPAGRWVIHVPNACSPFGMRIRYGDITHELAFTQNSLAQVLLSAGFSKVACYEDQPVVHGFKSAVRWILWQCIRSILRVYIVAETNDRDQKHVFSQNMLCVTFK